MAENKIQKRNTGDNGLLIAEYDNKDHRHRIAIYMEWLDLTGRQWHTPDLATYREYLRQSYMGRDNALLSPNSIRAHLSTVRGRYQQLLRDNRTRDMLYEMTPSDASPSDKKAFVDEIVQRIENAIDAKHSSVKVVTRQDTHDDEHLRLSKSQVETLIKAPGTDTLVGLRDTSVISLMLCTGIREAELYALDVRDLKRKLSGELALHVRHGKGAKERLIPYGSLVWVLDVVDMWLQNAGIESGIVFRGFYRGYRRIRDNRLSGRGANIILTKYPISIDGAVRTVKPHDLRRTYARLLYESGTDLLAIRDNLGHADSRTTLKYIGTMDVESRKPPQIFEFSGLSSETKHQDETD
ncbi:MAG: tyrosine-type recombinase/integrase [Aggregatilineales bacterium]